MANHLEAAVLSVIEAAEGKPVSDERRERSHALIWNNAMDGDDAPQWFTDLLQAVAEKRQTEWLRFPEEGYSYPDLFALIAELDEVLPMTYSHEEESIRLTFDSLGVEAIIWVESGQYRVTALKSKD